MAKPEAPLPVKLFSGVLFVNGEKLSRARELLIDAFGEIDFASKAFEFQPAEYYEPEMGGPIRRTFYSFRNLIDPADLSVCKLRTNGIEDELQENERRTVNIDCGYLDYGKVVLASMKEHNQKIYLGGGVYADMNLLYEKGRFKPLEWTFPDFRTGLYNETLLHIRAKYKAALRRERREKVVG